jgi:predicted RNase H-like HicB family nuclease
MELTARIHHEDGCYWAEVLELPGCFAAGDTLDELRDALAEAISLYMTDTVDGVQLVEFDAPDAGVETDELKLALV